MTPDHDMPHPGGDRAGRSALVVGATGLVGRELGRQLAAEPGFARVVALARRPLDEGSGSGVETVIADFDRLEASRDALAASHVFCALGTTIKQAGSQERFRQVDYGYPLRVAELAREAGARHYLLVSALGADPRSRVFYNRVKGEAEAAVSELPFRGVQIFRPSLLLGRRAVRRPGERLAAALLISASGVLVGPARKYRPVQATDVAAAMGSLPSL